MALENLKYRQNETDKRKAVISHIVKYRLFRDNRIINRFQNVFFRSLGNPSAIKESKSMWEIIYFLCGAHFSNENVTVSEIYHSIDVSKTATIACLTSLEELGALEKIADKVDRRRKIIRLTSKCSKIISDFVDDCVDQFSDLIVFGEGVERRKSEVLLRKSAERALQIASASSDWFWELDKDLKYVWISEDFEKKTGFPASNFIGKSRWNYFTKGPDAALSNAWEEHKQTMEKHHPFRNYDFRYVSPSGEIRHVSASGSPMFDNRGVFTGYIGATTDVTQIKRSESAILESEGKFREFAKLSNDWFWETDENHAFSWFSEEMIKVTGQQYVLRIGVKRWENHAPTSDLERQQMQQHRRDLDHQLPFRNFVYRAKRKGGNSVWTKISGNPQFDSDGNFIGYRGAAQDVTDSILTEQARKVDERRLRLLSDFSSVWCWEMDEHFRITWASIGLWECTGESLDSIIGSTRWGQHCPRNDEEVLQMAEHKKTLEDHQQFRDFVYRVKFKTGGEIWYRVSGSPKFDDDGKFIGYEGVASDFTDQQRRILLSQGQKTILEDIQQKRPIMETLSAISDLFEAVAPFAPMGILQIDDNGGHVIAEHNDASKYLTMVFGFRALPDHTFDLSGEVASTEWEIMLTSPFRIAQIGHSETQCLWAKAITSPEDKLMGIVFLVKDRPTNLNNITQEIIELSATLTGLALQI